MGEETQGRRVTSPSRDLRGPKQVKVQGAEAGPPAAVEEAVRRNTPRGFTLIELMLVVAIVGLLATISINEFGAQIMLAKRVEAVTGLGALYTAQQLHYLEHGKYAGAFSDLAFEIHGGMQLSPTSYRGVRYTYQISQPWGEASFYCIATAQLDGDPWPDILEIYEFGE